MMNRRAFLAALGAVAVAPALALRPRPPSYPSYESKLALVKALIANGIDEHRRITDEWEFSNGSRIRFGPYDLEEHERLRAEMRGTYYFDLAQGSHTR